MFMQRIEVPVTVASEPRPKALKLIAGTLFLAASLMVMPPYLLALGLFIGAAAAAHFLRRMATAFYQTLLFAGETVTGR